MLARSVLPQCYSMPNRLIIAEHHGLQDTSKQLKMDKQEEIWKGMATLIAKELAYPNWRIKTLVEVLLRYQMAKGVVIKTDRELPNEILCEDGSMCWVEPLLKER